MIEGNTVHKNMEEKFTLKDKLKFIIPSLLGLIIFLFPIKNANGGYTLIIGALCQGFQDSLGVWNTYITGAFIVVSALVTTYVFIFKPKFKEHGFLEETFNAGALNTVGRLVGAALFFMVLFGVGPEFVLNENIGPVIFDLLFVIGIWLIPSVILLPLMVEFGLMEFIGTLVNKFTRPLFKLPGRATVDLLTSWVGMVELGLVITNDQYTKGNYTKREAAIIASCFTATGVAFWLVCGEILGLSEYFLQFYIAIFVAGFASVVVMSRIPPLSKLADTYYVENKNRLEDEIPSSKKRLSYAFELGVRKAQTAPSIKDMLKGSFLLITSLFVTLIPIVMTIGVFALILTEYTPIFDIISIPFKYYLQLLQVPEAAAAAPATIVGFTDMFVPILISSTIVSAKTRFIIGVLALTQIVFMSEMGAYVLISKIPLKFKDLAIIFVTKTIILLPIITLLATLMGIPA
ncbi:YjiH family protein [Acidaminobacter sp. JC074]|uniref:YjiH family protein n=1 Tax=Acidaminobacter sp. JC074 TaxID=2530199 RepID=UPI001F100255|nr:YjiH family protein [Acidaminobacter sp. JC074]MCH4886398.1 YjiH family protein [Acidaminobacter sp. JC074]